MGKLTRKIVCKECGQERWSNVVACPRCGAKKGQRACHSCLRVQLVSIITRFNTLTKIHLKKFKKHKKFKKIVKALLELLNENKFKRIRLPMVPKEKAICPECGDWRSDADRERRQIHGDYFEFENHIPISADSSGKAFVCGVIRGIPAHGRKTGDIIEIVSLKAENPHLGRLYYPEKVKGKLVEIWDGIPTCWIPEVKKYLKDFEPFCPCCGTPLLLRTLPTCDGCGRILTTYISLETGLCSNCRNAVTIPEKWTPPHWDQAAQAWINPCYGIHEFAQKEKEKKRTKGSYDEFGYLVTRPEHCYGETHWKGIKTLSYPTPTFETTPNHAWIDKTSWHSGTWSQSRKLFRLGTGR